jgi:hypothetical protein
MPPNVTTTPEDILELAYGRLPDASPGNIADEAVELLSVVNRALNGLYAFAARINPSFFATVVTVPFESGLGWLRPADAESVFWIELTTGAEVAIVPYEQRHMEPGRPTVYALGQYYRNTGMPTSPTGGSLRLFYARRPTPASTLTSTLDYMWVEAYNELLALEVAIYLALKSDQQTELQQLQAERDSWAGRFAFFLQHETASERRAWATSFRLPGTAMTVLAGGSA